jgi:DNA-binding Lrp family transcriptional regulator
VELDILDRQVIDVLKVAPRAPFSRIATALGVSDQTVARRYQKLRRDAGFRVIGLPNHVTLGWDTWAIRLHSAPDATAAIASALARRPDTSWVTINSGGTEIVCIARAARTADRDTLLLQKLPKTPRLVSVTAHCVMRQFAGGAVGDQGRPVSLSPAQLVHLDDERPSGEGLATLDDADEPLLTALAFDGRTGFPELAAATGRSETTVRRRLEHLTRAGAVFYDVEFDMTASDDTARVHAWLNVEPTHLADVGAAMATHPEVVFAAATTGASNILGTLICKDMAALYTYLTERIGPLPGVTNVETAPILRHVKQVGAVL